MQHDRHIQRPARMQVARKVVGDGDLIGHLAMFHPAQYAQRVDDVLVNREHMVGVELHLPTTRDQSGSRRPISPVSLRICSQ